jgi:hypothetical protein
MLDHKLPTVCGTNQSIRIVEKFYFFNVSQEFSGYFSATRFPEKGFHRPIFFGERLKALYQKDIQAHYRQGIRRKGHLPFAVLLFHLFKRLGEGVVHSPIVVFAAPEGRRLPRSSWALPPLAR